MSTLSVLVIDDNAHRCESLALLLDFMEYHFEMVTSVNEAINLNKEPYELIICSLTDTSAVKLSELNKLFPTSRVLLATETQSIDEQRFQKYANFLGILEFPIKKPQFKSLIAQLNDGSSPDVAFHSILDQSFVGESVEIRQVKKLITQVAKSNASVLLLGESGTGKEVVANCLHKLSRRQQMPYVPVNCGAIPRDLLESELFGHEKGAFTGALTTRKGRFEMAQGGSLFLDEIGDMPLSMQVKILRVLQERVFERVGGNKSLQADVRVIAATHRNLEEEVKNGHFREDLYYRLNVFPIEIPALRDRVDDIPLLFNLFNKNVQLDSGASVRITPESMASLMQHPWPGNVRELSNLVERLGIMFPDQHIDWDDLPEKYQYDISHIEKLPDLEQVVPVKNDSAYDLQREKVSKTTETFIDSIGQAIPTKEDHLSELQSNEVFPEEGFDLKDHLANLEYSLIQKALEESDGVVAHAAKRLNMRRTTLVEKMKKYEAMFGEV